jgi:hypothetical protein
MVWPCIGQGYMWSSAAGQSTSLAGPSGMSGCRTWLETGAHVDGGDFYSPLLHPLGTLLPRLGGSGEVHLLCSGHGRIVTS